MIKKIVCAICAAAMMILVCGCGNNSADKGDGVPTLVWYVPGDSQRDTAAVMEAVNKLIEPKIGAKLDLKMIDEGAFSEKMSMKMASDEPFDLCFTGYVNQYKSGIDVGGFLELTDLLEKYGQDLKKDLPDYVLESAKEKGGIYAIPNMQIMANVEGIFFFEEYANKYGIKSGTEYKDIAEMEPYFDKIRQDYPNVYPVADSPVGQYLFDYSVVNQKPDVYVSDKEENGYKLQPVLDMKEYEQGLKAAKNWYDKGYLRSDIDTAVNNRTEDLRAGKYASFLGRWKPGIEDDHKNMYGQKTVFVSSGSTRLTVARDTMTAISRTSKNPEKAMQFLNLVNTDKELYNLICYGIEGRHYEKLDGEYIRPIENSGYRQLACWKFGNQFNAYLLEGQEPDIWEQTRKLNDSASKASTFGFSFDETPVKSEEAQCRAIVDEYNGITYGSSDYTKLLSEYKSRLENAGLNRIIEEAQKQLDEWVKENK